jgi:hypothetical protein
MDGHRNREHQNLKQVDQTKENGGIREGRGKCRLHRNREHQNMKQVDQTKEDGEIIEGRGKCRLHRM